MREKKRRRHRGQLSLFPRTDGLQNCRRVCYLLGVTVVIFNLVGGGTMVSAARILRESRTMSCQWTMDACHGQACLHEDDVCRAGQMMCCSRRGQR